MWKMFVSAAVLAVSDGPPETLTESQRGLYMLGVKAGGTVEPFAPTPGELARFRAGFESQLEGSGQPVDERTLIRHLMALDALRERRNPASKPPPGEEAVAEVQPEEAVKHEEPPAPPPVYRQVDIPAETPTAGPKDAKVTLVVWCDFGNACRKFYGHAKRFLNAYPRELRLSLRFFFPPNDISRDSLLAEAVLAAHEQGRFLDYLDALSPYRPLDTEGEISRQAEELGLDMDRFQEAVGLRRFRPRVEADTAEGKALGVTADSGYGFSPVLFINGREQRGYHAPVLEKLIVEEKARAERLLASGTAPEEVYARLIEGGQKPGPIEAPATPPALFDLSHSPSRGPATAPVTLVTFLRLTDSRSADVAAALRMVEQESAGKVRVVFKNWPHPQVPAERLVALATLAAHEQGRFWDYHDRLLSHPGKVDRKGLVAHARALGLELKRFEQALDSGRLEPQLEVDLREADWLGLDGARFYGATFVNGRKMRDPASITELRKVLDVRLRKAGAGR